MAIIYTYPRLNNPDGTELIVVSETKNKNSTRLITLAGICDFCDETSCDHSFKNVQTSSLTPAEAVGCDDTLTLTSSDASVTITNVGNTIDFKSLGGGPSGCPITYVLKPVSCNTETGEPICTIDEDARNWIFTCESSLSAVTPGYIRLSNNGSPVTYPIGDEGELRDCWYSDIWSPIPTGLESCEECCTPPADPVIRGSNCENGETLFEALQSNISGPAGWESAIDNDCEFGQFTGGETINCIKLTTAGTDDGSTPILDSIKSLTLPDCGCECCLYECSFILEPCPGDPPSAHDPLAGQVVAPDDIALCDTLVNGDVVNITFEGESYCYTLNKVCVEPTIPVTMALVRDCDDEACGSTPEIRYKWTSCDDEEIYFTEDVDPGVAIGTIRRYCCIETEDEDICYVYAGEDLSSPASAPPCPTAITDEPDCSCCANPCNYQYTKCPGDSPEGFPENIIVNVGKDKGTCECTVAPLSIYTTNEAEETWCYNTPVKTCDSATNVLVGEAECGNDELCPNETPITRKYRTCDTDQWYAEDPTDPIPYPGVPAKVYAGDLSSADCVFPNCCIEIETTTDVLEVLSWSVFVDSNTCSDGITISPEDDCDCCKYYDVATYTSCNEECLIEGYPSVNIDVCSWGKSLAIPQDWKPSSAPQFIKINIDGELECCYEKTLENPCVEETLISGAGLLYSSLSYSETWETCADCEERFFRYVKCNDSETSLYTSVSANPGIEDLALPFTGMISDNLTCDNDPAECCISIIEESVEQPLTLTPIDCWDTAYINAVETCECCIYQNVHRYTKCESEGCNIPVELNTIDLDTCEWFNITQASGAPIPQLLQVEIDGDTCCYEATGEWQCVEPFKPNAVTVYEGEDCETCDGELSNFKTTDCTTGAVVTTTEDLSAFVGQTWLINEEECVTVDTYHGPAGPPLGASFDTQYDQDPPCDCCRYRNVLQYDKCDTVEGEACDGMPDVVYVNNTVTGGALNAIFQETANPTTQCCYVLNETPPCVADEDALWTYVIWEETCEDLPEICAS